MQEEAPGMVFWHPNGWTMWQIEQQYAKSTKRQRLSWNQNPQIVDRSLWENQVTGEIMATWCSPPVKTWLCHQTDELPVSYSSVQSRVKILPWFCHCVLLSLVHATVMSRQVHSMASCVWWFYPRWRPYFCSNEQVKQEAQDFINDVTLMCIKTLVWWHPNETLDPPRKRVGAEESWDLAEKTLADALDNAGLDWNIFLVKGLLWSKNRV